MVPLEAVSNNLGVHLSLVPPVLTTLLLLCLLFRISCILMPLPSPLWFLYNVLVSMVTMCYMLTFEDMELQG